MNTQTSSTPEDSDKDSHNHGISEETSLTVKLLGDCWIVENGVGTSVGSADDRAAAIELARQASANGGASSISVLASDGTVEEIVETPGK